MKVGAIPCGCNTKWTLYIYGVFSSFLSLQESWLTLKEFNKKLFFKCFSIIIFIFLKIFWEISKLGLWLVAMHNFIFYSNSQLIKLTKRLGGGVGRIEQPHLKYFTTNLFSTRCPSFSVGCSKIKFSIEESLL